MKRLHLSVAAIGLVVLSVGAWWWQHRTSPAPAAAVAAPAAPPAAGPVPVEVARAVARDLTDDTTAVGSLRSRQGVVVRPEVSGRVVKLGFRDGERVRRGQVLVQLDDALPRAQLRQAEAQLAIARTTLQRNRELVAQNFVTQSVVDQAQANVDGLTGVYNRRFFEKQIAGELDRATRYEKALSVIMLDIDHFKKLNDEFGHLLGDEVLKQVSNIFRTQLRRLDFICRYGGEEFAIILPETGGEDALGVADKVRRMIEAHSFPGVPRPVTISLGVAECPAHGVTRDTLVKSADQALYASKLGGRNRVTFATAAQTAKA